MDNDIRLNILRNLRCIIFFMFFIFTTDGRYDGISSGCTLWKSRKSHRVSRNGFRHKHGQLGKKSYRHCLSIQGLLLSDYSNGLDRDLINFLERSKCIAFSVERRSR